MKCKAAEVLHDQRIDSVQRTYDDMSQDFLRILDSGAGIALRAQKDVFGKVRLERFYTETLLGIWDDVEFCKANQRDRQEYRGMFSGRETESRERGQLRDSIESVLVRNARELSNAGYDFYAVEDSMPLKLRERWLSPTERKYVENRMVFWRQFMPTVQVYISGGLRHLHDCYGFAAQRMRPVHEGIRRYCNRYAELWLDLRDKEAQKMLDEGMAEIRRCGVKMTYWGESEAEKIKEIPVGMEDLAWDKLIKEGGFENRRIVQF